MHKSISLLCLFFIGGLAAKSDKAAAKSDKADKANTRVAELTAEVESLRTQLQAAKASSEKCTSGGISVLGALSKSRTMAGDVVQHLLQKTDIDDKVVMAVSSHAEIVRAHGSRIYDQIKAHPCGSSYEECSKHITNSPAYQTNVAPHMKKVSELAQPYVDKAKVHVNPAVEAAGQAYSTASKAIEEHVPKMKQKSTIALTQASDMAKSVPGHLNKVLDPLFGSFSTAFPQHRSILPEDPVDRLLVVCLFLFVAYNVFSIIRFFMWITMRIIFIVARIFISLGIKFPFKLSAFAIRWGFWFGTGFYVCGLCRKRKKVSADKDPSKADAKAEPKKNGAVQQATVDELVKMLKKTQEKGKLDDGVKRLVTAAKNGKALTVPEEMKGRQVSKDSLKKALGKFKEVDIKKLGL
jgi:hypothetical protein